MVISISFLCVSKYVWKLSAAQLNRKYQVDTGLLGGGIVPATDHGLAPDGLLCPWAEIISPVSDRTGLGKF